MDNEIPGAFDQVSHCFVLVIQTVIGIIYATPFFTVAVIPLFLMYYFAQVSTFGRKLEDGSPLNCFRKDRPGASEPLHDLW